MEFRAYVEGYIRSLWLLIVILPVFLVGGLIFANSQTSDYTASTSILLNSSALINTAGPLNIVKLSVPDSYLAAVVTPPRLQTINRHYPRLSITVLRSKIQVSIDASNRILVIHVTDSKPESAVDIAKYLANQFVQDQNRDLMRQLDYYQAHLQQKVKQLQTEINTLNDQIRQMQPPATTRPDLAPPLPPEQRLALNTDQFKVDRDIRDLYIYNLALQDIQDRRPLFKNAYTIQHPASVSDVPLISPLSRGIVLAVAGALGIVVFVILIIVIEYFSPFVRHKGEVQRLTGISVLAGSPKIFSFEQRQLLELRPLTFFKWRLDALRLLCSSLGTPAIREGSHTLLLTSPRKKRRFAALLATFLACSGHHTLLVDADFEHPSVEEQVKIVGPANLTTSSGVPLSFICRTSSPHLFVLPGNAALSPSERITGTRLVELLPELEKVFNLIVIDGPPLSCADTHLLAPKVKQTLLLVKKRRDSLKTLKMVSRQCKELKLNVQGLLLT